MLWVGRALRQHLPRAILDFVGQKLTIPPSFSFYKSCSTSHHLCQSTTTKVALLESTPTPSSSPNHPNEKSRGMMLSEIVSLLEAGCSVEHILQDNATSALFSEHLLDRENTRKLAKAIARTRSPQEAHRVIELAHKMGSPLKQNVYEGVSHQL